MGAGGEVAGYAVADDVSARDLQSREPQWTRAKGFDTLLPVRPVDHDRRRGRATRDGLALRTWVNGELRQDSHDRRPDLRRPRSSSPSSRETCTLEPGDLILTGTPSGVGMAMDPPRFLASGDVVRIEIERLGAIEHAVL